MSNTNDTETSDTGWTIVCEVCNEHTATIRENVDEDLYDYYCKDCFDGVFVSGGGDLKCECGAESVGGCHSDWCPMHEEV